MFACTVFCAFFVSGCFLFYDSETVGEYFIGYRNFGKKAFIGCCTWDGDRDNMVFTVPDEYNGIKITMLGGYIGRGYPCPFTVSPKLDKAGGERTFSTDSAGDDDEYETLVFTVRFGVNISELVYVSGENYIGKDISDSATELGYRSDIMYKIVYRFEVDENNTAFYSKDGKLYNKIDDSLIDEFLYE